MSKKKTYVKPYKRRNKKKDGKHVVSGHTRRTGLKKSKNQHGKDEGFRVIDDWEKKTDTTKMTIWKRTAYEPDDGHVTREVLLEENIDGSVDFMVAKDTPTSVRPPVVESKTFDSWDEAESYAEEYMEKMNKKLGGEEYE